MVGLCEAPSVLRYLSVSKAHVARKTACYKQGLLQTEGSLGTSHSAHTQDWPVPEKTLAW